MVDPALHVEEHPAEVADAPVVVLVHGVLDSSLSFEPVVEALTSEFTVVTYDRRGWGRSAGASPPTTIADHADDLLGVLAGRRGAVVGHSYGGAVALHAAVRRPDLVAALGVFEPSLVWTDWWPSRETMDEQAHLERGHFSAGLAGRPRPSREQRARDRATVEREITLLGRSSLAFDDVTVPCLIGTGGLSAPWRSELFERLSAALGAELVVIDGAGHTAHRMQPKGFADFARQAVALGSAS